MRPVALCAFTALAFTGCGRAASSRDLADELSTMVGRPVEIRLIGKEVIDGQRVTCGLYGPTPATGSVDTAWPGAFATVGGHILVDAAARESALAAKCLRSFGYLKVNPIP